MNIITLTTDFGLTDWFVGAMKGAILSINPKARIVDLCHGVPSGHIAAGALALMAGCRLFPPQTIHVAVVDPGVGGARKPIAVATKNYIFIGPDNGVLAMALADEEIKAICHIENRNWFRPTVTDTFHGRDIFAPVAARLSKGAAFQEIGSKLDGYVPLKLPQPKVEVGRIQGEVIYIDHFGNAITNITLAHLGDIDPARVQIAIPRKRTIKFGRYYEEVPEGAPLGLFDSCGFLEIAVNRGNASAQLKLNPGASVTVHAVE